MPRIPPSLFRIAKRISPHAATLLPACRDVQSAVIELRWIKNHVYGTKSRSKASLLAHLCRQRGQGVPLQYILGSQPFGSLDIKCRPGVLIPRPETEAYTCHLIDLIKSGELLGHRKDNETRSLRIIDFCTGTGCIPLLLFAQLQKSYSQLRVRGVDISPSAIQLARENIKHNSKLGHLTELTDVQTLSIARGDVFSDQDVHAIGQSRWDILVSNPPYISRDVWNHGRGHLGYSVRKYEPRLALVPDETVPRLEDCDRADVFYARLLDIASILEPRIILLEVGDQAQAQRVLQLYYRHRLARSSRIELWRDWPDLEASEEDVSHIDVEDMNGQSWQVPVKGSGLVRSIFIQQVQVGRVQ